MISFKSTKMLVKREFYFMIFVINIQTSLGKQKGFANDQSEVMEINKVSPLLVAIL